MRTFDIVAFRGVNSVLAEETLDSSQLVDARNVHRFNGVHQIRPGGRLFTNPLRTIGRIIGTFQHTSQNGTVEHFRIEDVEGQSVFYRLFSQGKEFEWREIPRTEGLKTPTNSESRWNMISANELVIFHNGLSENVVFSLTDSIGLSLLSSSLEDAPPAKYGVLFGGRVIFANTPRSPVHIYWSEVGNLRNFSPTNSLGVNTGAGFDFLSASPDPIMGLAANLSSQLFAYKSANIIQLDPTFIAEAPFRPIEKPGIGLAVPGSLVNDGVYHRFVGSTGTDINVYEFDGVTPRPIGTSILPLLRNIINETSSQNAFAFLSKHYNEYWLFLDEMVLVYHVLEDAWWVWEWERESLRTSVSALKTDIRTFIIDLPPTLAQDTPRILCKDFGITRGTFATIWTSSQEVEVVQEGVEVAPTPYLTLKPLSARDFAKSKDAGGYESSLYGAFLQGAGGGSIEVDGREIKNFKDIMRKDAKGRFIPFTDSGIYHKLKIKEFESFRTLSLQYEITGGRF